MAVCKRSTCTCGCHQNTPAQPPVNALVPQPPAPTHVAVMEEKLDEDRAKRRTRAVAQARGLTHYDGQRFAHVVGMDDLIAAEVDYRLLVEAGWSEDPTSQVLIEPNRGF